MNHITISSETETYRKAHTVTEQDHEEGKFTLVRVGDSVVFVIKRMTTVEEEVIAVEGTNPEPQLPSSKGNKIVSVGEDAEETETVDKPVAKKKAAK